MSFPLESIEESIQQCHKFCVVTVSLRFTHKLSSDTPPYVCEGMEFVAGKVAL